MWVNEKDDDVIFLFYVVVFTFDFTFLPFLSSYLSLLLYLNINTMSMCPLFAYIYMYNICRLRLLMNFLEKNKMNEIKIFICIWIWTKFDLNFQLLNYLLYFKLFSIEYLNWDYELLKINIYGRYYNI